MNACNLFMNNNVCDNFLTSRICWENGNIDHSRWQEVSKLFGLCLITLYWIEKNILSWST